MGRALLSSLYALFYLVQLSVGTTLIPNEDGELMVNKGRSGLRPERRKSNSSVYVEQ